MAIFKCKMCGGTLEINEYQSVGVCDYCGTQQTLPKLDNDKSANLYDRANHFRRNNEYDKAMAIYENILNENGTDAEAYWSLVLCQYGIEYVEDPVSHKRVPTVNRAQFTSVFDDDNYKSAVKYADESQKSIYMAEADAINELQKGILVISQKEEPFDVFICYKETDKNGRRTPDSVLANDLYHQLTREGFKVFFARITLEDKLGTAYEPYIFAALNSAKVMVVLGTSPEYFNAVWVKNEWSRYLSLVKQSAGKKILIPAYKDMDPYDLPDEFSHLQAQDMSKLGFMQDLIAGIKKCSNGAIEKSATVNVVDKYSANVLGKLLKNGETYIRLENYSFAKETYAEITKDYPEEHRGWWGLIVCETENFSKISSNQEQLNIWYKYAEKLANAEEFNSLKEQYIKYIKSTARLAADKEMAVVKSIIKESEEKIISIEQNVQFAYRDLEGKKISYDQYISHNDMEHNSGMQNLKKLSIGRMKKLIKLAVGIAIILLGALFLIADEPVIGVVMMIIGLIIAVSKGRGYSLSKYKEYIDSTNVLIAGMDARRREAEMQFSDDSTRLNNHIEGCRREIAANRMKIDSCNKYLDLGEEKITEYQFTKNCEAIGVVENCDNEIKQCRNAVFGEM